MLRSNGLAMAAVLTLVAPAQVTASTKSIEPTGKWVINYADAQCAATRPYGAGDSERTLVLRLSVGGGVLQLALVAKGGKFNATEQPVKLGLSNGQDLALKELRYGLRDHAFRLVNLGGEQRDAFAGTSSLRWGTTSDALLLPLDHLGDVLKVLEDCRKNLREYWNVDEAVRNAFQRQVASQRPLITYINDGDYPDEAIRKEQSGTTAFVLLIDEKGALKDCMVEETSGVAILDIMSCIVFSRRAKFVPALDKDGKPVRSVMYSRVKWVMPE